ncbi:MAG: alpha/beta fold hydrolase, partial [Mycobacteriaceae bacterium]
MPAATAGTATNEQPQASSDITWEDCPEQVTVDTAECGRIDVPMYHAEPDGDQISVGFVRVPASDPEARRGTLFAVPGGPGDDGYSQVATEDYLLDWPDDMRAEWDMVAVQPRGLVGSTPLDCDHEPVGVDPVTENGGYLQAACEIGTPGYTDSLNTSENADDIDAVRAALGEEKISMMGVSYGSHLGSTYATKYPERVDKLVLDSGFDTDRAWSGVADDQTGGYTGALHDFAEWAAENNDTYGLGETPLEVYQSWSRVVVEESGTNPTVVPPPAEVGDLPPGLQWAGQPAADVLTAAGEPRARIENLLRMATTPGAQQSRSVIIDATARTLPQPDSWGELALLVNDTLEAPTVEEVEEQQQNADPDTNIPAYMNAMIRCNENQVGPDYLRIPEALWNAEVEQDPFSLTGDLAMSGIMCSGIEPDAPFVDIDGSALDTQPLQ